MNALRFRARLEELYGLWRSIRVYHLDRAHHRAMDALYRRFVRPGDLVFDIGAHVGDRISSFRRLGARVVALEPQPGPARVIRWIHGRDPLVTLLPMAAGAAAGRLLLKVNARNPTVSTASESFIESARGAPGWEGQVWDRTLEVEVTTLDRLVARFGVPAFVKIDVEGFEDRVLSGLSTAVPALSFEFTTIARDVARRCLERLSALGPYGFDYALGETQRLVLGRWVPAEIVSEIVARLPHEANSGDIYARLVEDR
ncbi:MAG: FkbM family methyltransferase [Geminicoccaceae bacterium]|nr:FkbM family methyltransferase [Geminicoccaceae bacterium]MCS7267858.1 FkbM family methyltransferase [Geminicoccaceae bacterium]MCX7630005.1 FkbM family methyltransferase [Geminicoccaceae bacterium]MDW8124519.1 FkbM family methyltransferase [Geminicoccaceae bacterium]MDW8341353.1 FkbM family methyltransferase [Geminicoccaceae bacterium]